MTSSLHPSAPTPSSPVMEEVHCRWVPGTTRVQVSRGGRQASNRVIELSSVQLGRIFGQDVVHALYLKGRAQVHADPQQIALLNEPK